MIAPMEKLFIYGLNGDTGNVLAQLLKLGCAQLSNPEALPEYEQLKELMQHRGADLYELEQNLSRFGTAISALSSYEGKKSMFAKRMRIGYGCLKDEALVQKALEICEEVEFATRTVSELKSQISKEEFLKTSLQAWAQLDMPLEITGTASIKLDYVILPKATNPEDVIQQLAQANLAAYITVQSTDKDQHYAVLLAHKTDYEAVWEIIRTAGGVKYAFEDLSGTAVENTARCDAAIASCQKEIKFTTEQFKGLAQQIQAIKLAYDVVKMKLDCARAHQQLLHTEDTFMLTAWVPKASTAAVADYLGSTNCYYQFITPAKDEDHPILLKNNKLVEPFEVITEMYSLPVAGSIDPDPFMAIFYFIFFGMMLSDAGYGLILLFGGLFALWKMELSPFAKKFAKLITLGGLSTVIWGAIYGSWFGNMVPQIADIFFGKTVNVPMLLDPLNDPITILIISFAIGAVHLFVGMGLKAYLLIRRGKVWDAIFDVGLWYLTLIGLPMMLIPGTMGKVGMWLGIAGAVGLILTQGRDKANIVSRLVSGVLSLYDITGYFSDVLSYSRILALGLATGVIANVVNIMGTLSGAGIVGAIFFVVIFCFGHMLNLAINALGTYVHASRLQYVEFFGKFYEGGGKPFQPLRANPKFVYVTDEEE